MPNKSRIWELDALRGFFILCVVVIHGVFDLRYFVLHRFSPIPVFDQIQQYGGAVFVILSGVCITLGSRSFRRGLLVFGCGMLITLVTLGMYLLNLSGSDIIIYFGALHLLGVCMMLYPLYRKIPTPVLAILSLVFILLGYWFATFSVQAPYLFPLGLTVRGFATGDYFPLFPHLGWYFLGVVLGRTVYRQKRSLLPNVPQNSKILRFFRFCGRHSLWIYLLHQPLLYLLVLIFS